VTKTNESSLIVHVGLGLKQSI